MIIITFFKDERLILSINNSLVVRLAMVAKCFLVNFV